MSYSRNQTLAYSLGIPGEFHLLPVVFGLGWEIPFFSWDLTETSKGDINTTKIKAVSLKGYGLGLKDFQMAYGAPEDK